MLNALKVQFRNTDINHNFEKQGTLIKAYCVAVICAILLTPRFPTPAGLPSMSLSDILLILVPCYVWLAVDRIIVDARVIILTGITVLITGAIFWGAVLGFNASAGDLFFLFRIAKYCGAVLLASALVMVMNSSDRAIRWFLKRCVTTGLVLGLIVFQQYFDLLNLNELYVRFVAPTQYETLVGGYPWPRPVGMTGNPNELGFLLGLLSLASVWLFIVESGFCFRWGFAGFVYGILMVLTMSRSAGFSILVGFFILIMLFASRITSSRIDKILNRKTGFKALLVILLFATGAQLVISRTSAMEKIFWRFSAEYVGKSYETRLENWRENFELIKKSPILGVGTLKRGVYFQHAADNEWLLLLRTGGIFLPLLVAGLFLSGLTGAGSLFHRDARNLVLALTSASFVYMIFAGVFFSLTMMSFVLFLLVLACPVPVLDIVRGQPRKELEWKAVSCLSGQVSSCSSGVGKW